MDTFHHKAGKLSILPYGFREQGGRNSESIRLDESRGVVLASLLSWSHGRLCDGQYRIKVRRRVKSVR
ncbi:hypothetical protein LINGRAHAP2_LOCUS3034, partial [Linum grandiflorum]